MYWMLLGSDSSPVNDAMWAHSNCPGNTDSSILTGCTDAQFTRFYDKYHTLHTKWKSAAVDVPFTCLTSFPAQNWDILVPKLWLRKSLWRITIEEHIWKPIQSCSFLAFPCSIWGSNIKNFSGILQTSAEKPWFVKSGLFVSDLLNLDGRSV